MSKINIVAAIVACFINHPNEKKIFVTGDGQCFLENGENHAKYHARINDLNVKEVLREEYDEQIKTASSTVSTDESASAPKAKGKGKGTKPADETPAAEVPAGATPSEDDKTGKDDTKK